jgi:hypothetical protein
MRTDMSTVFTNVSAPIRDDLLEMSLDENSASSELMLSALGVLWIATGWSATLKITIQGHRRVIINLSVRIPSFR